MFNHAPKAVSFAEPDPNYQTQSVISTDGTRIGYRQYGHGPGLVLVQGVMGTVANYDQLARTLADTFTVYVPERRGLSPRPYTPDHRIERDVESLKALLHKTGAHGLFGFSSGAIITAAISAFRIVKAAPAFFTFLPRFLLQEQGHYCMD